jgi:ubiquinone/menaquinone biosynthesis C-methylase UbiE
MPKRSTKRKQKHTKAPKIPKESFNHLANFYNNNAVLYEKLSRCEDYNDDILRTLDKNFEFKGKIILELGAGTGRFTIPLAKRAKTIYALDNSKSMLGVLRKKIHAKKTRNIKILKSRYSRIPLRKESVDIVISVWSFPTHSRNWDKDMMQVDKVLRKGGMMIFIDNYKGGEYYRLRMHTKNKEDAKKFEKWGKDVHNWHQSRGFKNIVVNTLLNFGSKGNVEKICGPFFGFDISTRLLMLDKTKIRHKLSIFYKKK